MMLMNSLEESLSSALWSSCDAGEKLPGGKKCGFEAESGS